MNREPHARHGFTLIEMLVAMAVLTMLMTFMFGLIGGTLRLWEQGNSQVEAAQAARVGLNRLTEDLRGTMAGVGVSATPSGNPVTNIIPFFATNNATTVPSGWSSANFSCSAGSDQLFGVRATGDSGNPYEEIGYFSVFVTRVDGFDTMRGKRHYLARHVVDAYKTNNASITNTSSPEGADFFLRSPNGSWVSSVNGGTGQRFPIIDNCLRVQFLYASNNGTGVTWTPTWSSQTNLPLGVLATVITIDSRTAERVAKLNNSNAVTAAQIDAVTNSSAATDPVGAQLRQNGVVMRRFIPFPNSK